MPSPDRSRPSRDRPKPDEPTRRGRGRARKQHAPIEPPQYFDPGAPWDTQSAEALTQLYESGEGYLHPSPEDERARQRSQPPQHHTPVAPPAMVERASPDNTWLEARLAEIAGRLQESLAEINPDKAVAHLNGRLDAIEARFNEALSQVVQRSDLDGLKLIEAHVMELAAHVEHTRGRLDRLDSIDDQMQGIVRRLEATDDQRLDALEKQLQDYIAEWRKGDERTATALRSLEDVVSRVGESIDAMEQQRPAPDLSLSVLGDADEPATDNDPLSQVYAEAAQLLEPSTHRTTLDAADYAPKDQPAAASLEPETQSGDPPEAEQSSSLLPPALRALAMRARLRPSSDAESTPHQGPEADEPAKPASRRARSNLFLAGGLTLFAAIGYLLVDLLMTTSPVPRGPVATEQTARPAEVKAAAAPVPQPQQDSLSGARETSGREADDATSRTGRIDGIGSAMAAAFRREEAVRAPVEATASIQKNAHPTPDEVIAPAMGALPMTIGPASLRQAAMRGDATAQIEVASRFAAGQGVERDLQQSFQWYGRAATQGAAIAQYRLAALYERGLGATRDTERARIWYARAAEQGNVKAMHNLAVLNASGNRSDYAAAAKWFALAAEFGLTDSQVNLAILYQNGMGVPKDLARAYKWLALAGRGGDRDAAGRMAQAKTSLSPAELEAADAMITSWRPRTPEASANEAAAARLDTSQ